MRLRPVLVLCLAFGQLCVYLAVAGAEPAAERWATATDLMAAGDSQQAATLLLELYRDAPESALADDALFLAGNLQEDKLGDPEAARATYTILLEQYPGSRSSLSARRRLDALESAMGSDNSGAEPLARFSDILISFPSRKPSRSLAMAQELIGDYPDWSELFRVRLWIADTYRRQGDLGSALPHYLAVLESNAPADGKRQASLGAAEIQILQGEYEQAAAQIANLRTFSVDASDMHAIDELVELLQQSRSRSRLLWLSKLSLAAMAMALLFLLRRSCRSWRHTWEQLRRPPSEVLYMVPIAVLMTAMALTGHQEIGPAVATITIGGVLIAWLCGCALRAKQPLSLAHTLLCASAATLASASLVYLAVYRSSLLDLILTTVQFGPE